MKVRSRSAMLAVCCASACLMSVPAPTMADDGDRRVKLRAEAEDELTDLRFKASYKARSDDDRSRQKFKVRVWDAIPGELLPVSVNGLFLDFIQVDNSGNGRFRYRSEDMPDALPAFEGGYVVTVGPLEAAFEDRDRSGRSSRSRLRLRAEADDSGVQFDVKYDAKTRRDRLRRRFKATVEGAEEGDEFDVFYNDELLGTIEADEWGEGKLHFKAHGAHTDEFPMMQEGDEVTVGDTPMTLSLD